MCDIYFMCPGVTWPRWLITPYANIMRNFVEIREIVSTGYEQNDI